MFCIKCGAKIEEGNKFCMSCGNSVEAQKTKVENINSGNVSTNRTSSKEDNSNKGLASLIIGIVTLFIPILPLSILGLVLGIKESHKDGKRIAGIILNTISLIISVFIAIIIGLAIYFVVEDSRYDYDYYDEYDDYYDYYSHNQVIGNDIYGYLVIPNNWYKFVDVEANTSVQYSYLNQYIVSLNVVNEKITLEEAATNMETNMNKEAPCSKKETTIGKYKAYVISTQYSDGIYLDAYLLKAEDGIIHYIAIEGPDNKNDYFKIPNTFSLKDPILYEYNEEAA